ncbi:tetratricopeptide repeat domain protein [Aphanothece sacrum FPU1]|uniref:Tetratricopeptide repeat domain protein n=2 Tax=Aphanothece sacrum TaxID=1122 RepID=A0A401ID55_APHSA|nr:tetratricopeptide repeat domain protein [Aphanothece sacrum FPU1]GBF85166.1 tetratricopeptide repeat protein [Aphanothece sacrum FPU3]
MADQFQSPETCYNRLRTEIREKANQGDYNGAITLLDQLIVRYPDHPSDYNNRGLMHLQKKNYIQAMADFNQAIALNPSLDRAYNNRGNCQSSQGNLIEALEDYEKALDLNPYNEKAWINQGITLRELEWYELALDAFDFALLIPQKLAGRLYAERGYTYHVRGDWNCAIADYYRGLCELSPDDPYQEKIKQWLDQLLSPLNV